jgi:serine/threonine protein kinase
VEKLAAGTVIAGRYAVVRLLGTGSTKQVYLADDRLAATPVALAVLVPTSGARDPTLAARFSREGRAASVLRSPFTVRVFDVGKLGDGTRYLVTEAVLGRGLDAALAGGPVPAVQAARWALHVLAALAEAHGRGIIHRDVKPENVLLAPFPGGEVAKLTDFGLAKLLDGSLEGSFQLRTAQNILLGTPQYMPPEQWHGHALDGRTDLYAVGVMLYEMLVGRVPFDGRTVAEVCTGHLTSEVPAFPAAVPAAMRALEPVVRCALEKRTTDRFPSADAMREAVER